MTDLRRKRPRTLDDDVQSIDNHSGDDASISSPDNRSMTTRKRTRLSSSSSNIPKVEEESDIDETGEEKVDKFGRLLGGREYRVPTFQLPTRGKTLFMFAKDPSALLGYRDSFAFLKKNTKLVKVHIDSIEKGYLVDSNLLRATFRTREISVVTARSVFKEVGHRIIRKGKKGIDDYYYAEPSEEEDISENDDEQQLPEDVYKPLKSTASQEVVVPQQTDNLLFKPTPLKNTNDNNVNKIYQTAVSTRQFNASLYSYRVSNPSNYDLLSNVYQIPKTKQAFVDNRFT